MKRLPYFPSSDGPLSLWCKNFKQKRISFLDKVRNMSDDEFSKFKDDFQNGNFRRHWKQHAPESNS